MDYNVVGIGLKFFDTVEDNKWVIDILPASSVIAERVFVGDTEAAVDAELANYVNLTSTLTSQTDMVTEIESRV